MSTVPAVSPAESARLEWLRGCSASQIERLRSLRDAYQRGRYRELTDENKRMLFARWCYRHGRLSDQL